MPHKLNPAKLPAVTKKKPRYQLAPFQSRFALFYATEGAHGQISRETQVQVAQLYANEGRDPSLPPIVMTYDKVRTMKEHPQFVALVNEIREKGAEASIELARTIFANNMPTLASYHQWAADLARAKQDYRAMPMFTSQLFKHLAPQNEGRPATVININIPEARRHLVYQEPAPIEYEVVPRPEPEEPA